MKEEKKIVFTQKWIGDAVKKFLQKEDIYKSDMERIKYMRIGDCNFGGDYTSDTREHFFMLPPYDLWKEFKEEYEEAEEEEDEDAEDWENPRKRWKSFELRAMPLLRVLEVVETRFVSLEGIDDLARLKQLCCWLD